MTESASIENKAKDTSVAQDKAAHDPSDSLIKQVHQHWDSLKDKAGEPGIAAGKTADKPADKTADKPADKAAEKPADKAAEKPADKAAAKPQDNDSFWSWLDVSNIFDSTATTAKSGAAAGAQSSDLPKDPAKDIGQDGTLNIAPLSFNAAPESHWWSALSGAGHYIAGAVEKGWDNLTASLSDAYSSIRSDKTNITTKIEAHVGADGKPEYFESRSDHSVRTLSEGEQRYRDSKGGSIIRNTKTGEITSQSADGGEVYTRKADGTELLKTGDLEYIKEKDGKYHVRDREGNETEVTNQGAITRLKHGFSVAQRITTIDATAAKPEEGQLETMTDGQRYKDRQGNVIIARENGVREVTTADGKHFRFDRDHHTIEIEEDGKWRSMSRQEFRALRHCHVDHDGHGQDRFKINGVTIDRDGKVDTQEKVTLGQATHDGKMTATVPTDSDKPAIIVNNPDHTSTLSVAGHVTRVNPGDPTHLVEQFKQNADGSLGASQFSFNSQSETFSTPFAQFGPDGTHLNWVDVTIDHEGSVFSSTGIVIFQASKVEIESSSASSQQACQSASAAIAAVSSKIGSQAMDSGDVAALTSCLGDLDGAMSAAMSCGNFVAMCQIMSTRCDLESAISQASEQVALAEVMRANNMSDSDIVAAAGDVSSRGVYGAAVDQEVAVLGADSRSYEGRLAYFNQTGKVATLEQDSLSADDQLNRLSA